MIKTILFIAIGGAVGSVLRYLSSILVLKFWSNNFPLATLLVNILGCFLIGFIIGFFEKNQFSSQNLRWLLISGFCGGFTTFSAFGYENYQLFQSNNFLLAIVYIALTIFFGLFSIWFGLFLAK